MADLLSNLSGGMSAGGSSQSSANNASGYSETNGTEAREWSAQQAQISREWSAEQAKIQRDWQEAMMQKEMDYNAKEAQKVRDYQQAQVDVANEMANTVYTRSAQNMKEAGINPILAFSHGLGGVGSGSVSSGATASTGIPVGSTGQSFMAQSFTDQHSAYQSNGNSHGSSWQNSESGLATGLKLLGDAIAGGLEKMNAGQKIDISLQGIEKLFNKDPDEAMTDIAEGVAQATGLPEGKIKDAMVTKDSGKYKALKKANSDKSLIMPYLPQRINEQSWGKK